MTGRRQGALDYSVRRCYQRGAATPRSPLADWVKQKTCVCVNSHQSLGRTMNSSSRANYALSAWPAAATYARSIPCDAGLAAGLGDYSGSRYWLTYAMMARWERLTTATWIRMDVECMWLRMKCWNATCKLRIPEACSLPGV